MHLLTTNKLELTFDVYSFAFGSAGALEIVNRAHSEIVDYTFFFNPIQYQTGDMKMNLYAILRRDGFTDGPTLEQAAARSTAVGDDMSEDIRWIRSYVLNEESGALGTVCIYEASSEEAIRKHAAAADLSISEIIPVIDTVIVRPDP